MLMGSLARWWQSCGREWRSWKVGVLSKRGVAFLVAVSVFNPLASLAQVSYFRSGLGPNRSHSSPSVMRDPSARHEQQHGLESEKQT